jgi:hypothetical protein
VVEKRGPALAQAYDSLNQPTKALEGFARGQGVRADQLERDNYVYAVKRVAGRPTAEVLPQLCLDLLNSLRWGKAMRWNSSGIAYSRPLRWIVALYGDQVVPFTWAGVASGNVSRGPRFADAAARCRRAASPPSRSATPRATSTPSPPRASSSTARSAASLSPSWCSRSQPASAAVPDEAGAARRSDRSRRGAAGVARHLRGEIPRTAGAGVDRRDEETSTLLPVLKGGALVNTSSPSPTATNWHTRTWCARATKA